MDLLQKTFVQISELAASMSPRARIMAAASLAFVVLAAAWLSNQSAEGPDAYLMGRQSFSASQLGNMEAAFGKAGLIDYRIEGSRVRVPRGQQSKYMAALADAGAMPQESGEYLREAVKSGGFMVSGSRQQAQIKIALEIELQRQVSRMKGVKSAFVHIAEQRSRGLKPTKSATASVSVEPSGPLAIDAATIAAIREFVAASWGGLTAEAVTVVTTTHVANPPRAAPSTGEANLRWLDENWASLGVAGLILAAMLMAWLTLRTVAPAAVPEPGRPESLAANEDSPTSFRGNAAGVDYEPAPAPAGALREELVVMIRRDPQAAAGVLRTWIGNAS